VLTNEILVLIPVAQLNANLVRPIIVLLIASMFKLKPLYYIYTAVTTNLGFYLFVSFTFPNTSSLMLVRYKFYLVFVLFGLSVIMVARVRQTDRYIILSFPEEES
jgi:cAMP-specific phosphodiesterase 4